MFVCAIPLPELNPYQMPSPTDIDPLITLIRFLSPPFQSGPRKVPTQIVLVGDFYSWLHYIALARYDCGYGWVVWEETTYRKYFYVITSHNVPI